MSKKKNSKTIKSVETITHDEASRKNIPTAECQSLMHKEESFFVRHAYFLGANDPHKALKTTLKAEINDDAWDTLNSDVSRPFEKPKSGRIAVKVINHLGDEVMKVFKIR